MRITEELRNTVINNRFYEVFGGIADKIDNDHERELAERDKRIEDLKEQKRELKRTLSTAEKGEAIGRMKELYSLQESCKHHKNTIRDLKSVIAQMVSNNEKALRKSRDKGHEHAKRKYSLKPDMVYFTSGQGYVERSYTKKLWEKLLEKRLDAAKCSDGYKVSEGMVELPKDKNGTPLADQDKPIKCPRGVSVSWSLDYDNGDWLVSYNIKNVEYTDNPSECELVKEPYDKTYRTIERGDWVVCDAGAIDREPFLVTNTEKNDFGDIELSDSVGVSNWIRRVSHCYEIVPEPDTIERIENDSITNIVIYWGCSLTDCESCPSMVDGKTPKERYDTSSCSNAMQLDIIARVKAVCGGDGSE